MADTMSHDWPYPGSRCWKFDYQAHTPASADAPWVRDNLALSSEDWRLEFMAAGVDCVAVTAHHSGAWSDGCRVLERGALQDKAVREEVCRVMEGSHAASSWRWARLGREV